MRETFRKSSSARGYNNAWAKYRLSFLRNNPLCTRCKAAGRTTPATVVDHIEPHKGDSVKFWAPENHQSLCMSCHSGDKQRQEKSGSEGYRGAGPDGSPLDPSHHWNGAA